jgi:hypothetical protein
MIGYYIHHHGYGHRTRASSICARLDHPVTALTSMAMPDYQVYDYVVQLPRDDTESVVDPTANGAFHWIPLHHSGLRERMRIIAQWVTDVRPAAMVIDVSVEVATLVRLLGVPVVVIAIPGDRTDSPHSLVYQLADHIVAAWPPGVYEPTWLEPYASKTTYVGGISRFDGRPHAAGDRSDKPSVLALGGAGGSAVDLTAIRQCAARHSQFQWTALGVPGAPWVHDPWPAICRADIVVSHAGQSCIADIAAAARPAIVIPQRRPFNEQHATASVLDREGLAVTHPDWPANHEWPDLLDRARSACSTKWRRWRTCGAATRAAEVIDRVASRHDAGVVA